MFSDHKMLKYTLKILQPMRQALHEKCPNTEFFLVRIFQHSDWIRGDTEYLSVFSPNAGKYGPEKSLHYDTFHAVRVFNVSLTILWTVGVRKLTSSMSDGLFCCLIAQIWRMWNFSILEKNVRRKEKSGAEECESHVKNIKNLDIFMRINNFL